MFRLSLKTLANTACLTALFAGGVLLNGFVEADKYFSNSAVTAVLFEWNFDSIARECTTTLGPKGYNYVQVSPPQEHVQGPQWYTSYQPVSYNIAGRLGDRVAFKRMIDTCRNAGVGVVVDTVINHMTLFDSGVGTGGTSFTRYNYPGTYQYQDFHHCGKSISDYGNRQDVQECELGGLADLNTGAEYVRNRLAQYFNDLISLGVAGFRVDAAKHMPAGDLVAIRGKLSDPSIPWVLEAIFGAGEAVSPSEYLDLGSVQEFRYAWDLKRIFLNEKIAYLKNYGEAWGYMAGAKVGVFVANHDTEREDRTLSYKNGALNTLASIFMLAHPYGSPAVHSGYEFANKETPVPTPDGVAGKVKACYQDSWKCEHAWNQIANMVYFRRNVSSADPITNWWDNQGNAIAFGRGSKAFVVINREGFSITQTFQTSLPAGSYCDIQHGDITSTGGCTGPTITVGSDGKFTATVGSNDAVAFYLFGAGGVTTKPPTPVGNGISFNVVAQTVFGDNIFVVGNIPELGSWSPANAVALSAGSYPVWKKDVAIAAGTAVEYKYIKKTSAGAVVWESGANRAATVPASDKAVVNDTFRA